MLLFIVYLLSYNYFLKAATNYKEIMSSPKSKDKKASQSERLKLKEVKQESSIFQTHCSQKKKMQTKR